MLRIPYCLMVKPVFTAQWTISQLRNLQYNPWTMNEPANGSSEWPFLIRPRGSRIRRLQTFRGFYRTKNTFPWFRISVLCFFLCSTFCPNFKYATSSAFLSLRCVPVKVLELLRTISKDSVCYYCFLFHT